MQSVAFSVWLFAQEQLMRSGLEFVNLIRTKLRSATQNLEVKLFTQFEYLTVDRVTYQRYKKRQGFTQISAILFIQNQGYICMKSLIFSSTRIT